MEEQSIMADQRPFGNPGRSPTEVGAQARDRAQEAGAQARDRAQEAGGGAGGASAAAAGRGRRTGGGGAVDSLRPSRPPHRRPGRVAAPADRPPPAGRGGPKRDNGARRSGDRTGKRTTAHHASF